MKSNVKLAAFSASAMLVACKSSPDADGLVAVPMAESAPSASVAVVDAGADAAAHRVAIEPRAPNGQTTCTRDVECVAQLPSPPTYPYGAPYENCDPAPLGETGHFSPRETAEKRHEDPTMCCYVSFNGCAPPTNRGRRHSRVMIGRPLRGEGGELITAQTNAHEWDEERAQFWANGGALEHASVAEFTRISLALHALSAPPELLDEVHRAGLDEIEHARICFAIASRFAGREISPGVIDMTRASEDVSLASLVRDALVDGCVGEARAARELRNMARAERDPEIAEALFVMAEDEARHAQLAWHIVDFAMTRDEATTRAEIARFTSHAPLQSLLEDDFAREA